jgi:hypothetical protein
MGRKHTWRKVLLSCSESVKPYCSYECFQGKSCMVQRGAKKRKDDPQAYFTSDIFTSDINTRGKFLVYIVFGGLFILNFFSQGGASDFV